MELTYTGERYHPDQLGEIRQEHIHRYAWALNMVTDLDVVDIACGEGFGSSMLAEKAKSVIGIDISSAAVAHAASCYQARNLSFLCADAAELPLQDQSADVVVSFETIEHVADQARMLAEIRRILRPDGFLVMSSPNTVVYSQRQGHVNEFHLKELTREEFIVLVAEQFPVRRLFGQRLSVSSSILSCDDDADGVANVFRDGDAVEQTAREIPDTMYFLGLAAAREDCLPTAAASFLVSARYDVYWKMRDQFADASAHAARVAEDSARLREALSALTAENEEQAAAREGLAAEHAKLTAEKERLAGETERLTAEKNRLMAETRSQEHLLALAGDCLAEGQSRFKRRRAGQSERPEASPFFDRDYYLRSNPDVAEAGLDPLVHYLVSGRREGRLPKPPPGGEDEATGPETAAAAEK